MFRFIFTYFEILSNTPLSRNTSFVHKQKSRVFGVESFKINALYTIYIKGIYTQMDGKTEGG